MKEKPNVLLMFSGGLDSTGAFWRLIAEGRNIHAHHLYLVNKENRAFAEDKSVKEIVEYMKNAGGRFSYSESFHEYPCYNGNFLWDSDILSFMAGAICLSMKSIKEVAIGMTKSDMSLNLSARIGRANSIFQAFGTEAVKVYPVGDLTKKQIYEMLPEDLRRLSWSCRTPVYVGDDIRTCGRCKACSEMSGVWKELRKL